MKIKSVQEAAMNETSNAGGAVLTPMNSSKISSQNEPSIRLSKNLSPKKYDITIKVDPDAGVFSGEERIALEVKSGLSQIVLHGRDLKIKNARMNEEELSVSMDAEAQTISLSASSPLKSGTLSIAFSGTLNRQMRGLYLSTAKHKEKDGSEKLENYAFTQFEAIDARRMFPCFDEPSFKATFKLTVSYPEKFNALSNMPEKSSSVQNGWKTAVFLETPKMSTYLLALAVARLVPSKTVKVGKTKITVWTRPEDAGQTAFALDAAQKTLSYLNGYFKIPYSLPKMDLVAVPDFSAGAMENWGAIFFRDSAVLIDPKMSSIKAKQRVDEVVSHEIVHQWFGDLVTMDWWDDLWLNESFATWLAYKVVDHKRPKWLTWQNFERERRAALSLDALKNTRTVSSPVHDPAQIEAMFDVLTYEKGGSILRMIENFLTETKFRDGVRSYMKKHQYANTKAADLWNQLKAASKKPVDRMAKDWLTQEGYPGLFIEGDLDLRTLKISQYRFMINGTKKDSQQLWSIPVVIRYKDASGLKTARLMIQEREMKVTLPGKGKISWLYPNAEGTGYYRAFLSQNLRQNLLKNGRKNLSTIERSAFLADLWAQMKSGEVQIAEFMDALTLFKEDSSRMILEDLSAYLKTLYYTVLKDGDRPLFAKFTSELLGRHWKKLAKAKKGESDEVRLSRAAVLSALGTISPSSEILSRVKKDLALYLKSPEKLDPTIVFTTLSLNAFNGTEENFSVYQERFQNAKTPEVRDNFLAAMTDFKSPDLTQKLLALVEAKDSQGQDVIRGQDAWRPVARLLGNPWSQRAAWKFVQEHWDSLRKKVGAKGSERIIQGLAGMDEPEYLKEIHSFFSVPQNQVPSAKRSLAQTVEYIEAGIKFKATQTQAFSDWLKKRV